MTPVFNHGLYLHRREKLLPVSVDSILCRHSGFRCQRYSTTIHKRWKKRSYVASEVKSHEIASQLNMMTLSGMAVLTTMP